ncbi:MAG: beta-galactosidase [Lachnospirales bacterium]
MSKKYLFSELEGFIHGGDYNPEQWLDRPDILEKDIVMMKKAKVNAVTLGVFSWSMYEFEEGVYNFQWLSDIMDNLFKNNIYTILATPSGARPAWLDKKYPEAMRVGKDGLRNHHGVRHNHCMSSLEYRRKVKEMDSKLGENFGEHPGLLLYHISNEFGGECYCPQCVEKFQGYLRNKFKDIETLNKAWWTVFWSHRYNDFEQIEPPFANGEGSVMGLNLEWKRFTTWNTTDFMKLEIDTLKSISPNVPVTTNFMTLYNGLDYRKLANEIDIISWDSYPRFNNNEETMHDTMLENAFNHELMRSMKKDRPFMLMESTPSLVNWHDYNKLKRPNVHKLASIQAIACGSDTVQYFQWRKSRGSFEQYHGAVVDHLGTDDTRVFKEVENVGNYLEKISKVAGTTIKSKVALIFDWDNRWAIQDAKALSNATKKYEETSIDIWKEFTSMGVHMDIISSEDDFREYDVIVAPMLYLLQPNVANNLKEFVIKGGQLLGTYFTGYVDENQLCYLGGFPGDGLSEVFGIVSEEIDTLYPEESNRISFKNGFSSWETKDYAEVLRVKDAKVIGTYTKEFYSGKAAVTCNCLGNGKAYYVAARSGANQMRELFVTMLKDANIQMKTLPKEIEYHMRSWEEYEYEFYLNNSDKEVEIKDLKGMDLITNTLITGSKKLDAYDVLVVEKSKSSF